MRYFLNQLSLNSFANYFILFSFILLIPFEEWPDTNTYFLQRDFLYVEYIKNYIIFFDLNFPAFTSLNIGNFFQDSYFYEISKDSLLINLSKLPIAIILIYIINIFSYQATSQPIVFSPVFIFSILSISNEPFAITLIVISYLMILSNRLLLPFFIAILAIIFDRSMVVSFAGLAIYLIIINIKSQYTKIFVLSIIFAWVIIIGLLIINYNIGILNDFLSIFGLTEADLKYNQKFGKQNYAALLASLSGLYGWMSLRPSPWFVYYSIVLIFFIIGFFESDNQYKILLICFIIPTIFTLFILPPMSQARYFPILTLLYWDSVIRGAKKLFGDASILVISLIFMTFLGLALATI